MRRVTDIDRLLTLPEIDVDAANMERRFNEWAEAAAAHAGELVVIYDDSTPSPWQVMVGRISRCPTLEEDYGWAINLCVGDIARCTDTDIVMSPCVMRVGYNHVWQSFQRVKAHISDREGVPRFDIAFGNQAVARWFRDNDDRRDVSAHMYPRVVRRFGVEPIIVPEVIIAVQQRTVAIVTELVRLAMLQMGRTNAIEIVHESVGRGVVSLFDGLVVGDAPTSHGDAYLRTHRQRESNGRDSLEVDRLKRELVELGVDTAAYNQLIVQVLGLSLPKSH